jgi:hypothetical protein
MLALVGNPDPMGAVLGLASVAILALLFIYSDDLEDTR